MSGSDAAWRLVRDGLAFGEAPRWRDDGLYVSDMHADRIIRVQPDGACEMVARFDGPVSGLGWLPDGRMLAVDMHRRRVLARAPDGAWGPYADLAGIATGHCNDMVVSAQGRAYVGNFGFALDAGAAPRPAVLARIDPSGGVHVAADGLDFPNGCVITPDSGTLVVAESRGRCLTAFDIAVDGTLSGRRLWAAMPAGAFPDGICLDAEGAIWVASPSTCEMLRLREGGAVADRIPTGQEAIACTLGDPDRRTLYVCTAPGRDPAACRAAPGARLLAMKVATQGAGLP